MPASATIINTTEVLIGTTRFRVLGGVRATALDQMVTPISIGEGDSTREEKASKWWLSTTSGGFGRYQLRPGSGDTPDKVWDADVRTDSDEITLLPEPTAGITMSSAIVDAIEFGAYVYFVAGTRVARYNPGTDTYQSWCTTHSAWETYVEGGLSGGHTELALSATATSLDIFGTKLLIWCGTHLTHYDGSTTWTTVVLAGSFSTAFDGYCVRATPAGEVYKSEDLTTWSAVGDTNSETPTSICVFRDGDNKPTVYVGTVRRPWLVDIYNSRVQPTMVRFSDTHADNCRGMVPWGSELLIPKGAALRRYMTGGSEIQMSDIGLTQGDGLPSEKVGRIVDLEATLEHMLVAAVDAGASGVSGVYFTRGAAWHPLVEAASTGAAIRAVAFSSLTTVPRLWYGEGSAVKWVPWFDTTANPVQLPSGMTYKSTGDLITPWFGAPEFRSTAIDFRFLCRDLSQDGGRYVDVYVAYNNADDAWLYVGRVQHNGGRILSFDNGGKQFRTIRVMLSLVRGATATKTPRVLSCALRWTPMPRILLGYQFDVDMTASHAGKTPAALESALLAYADGAVVPFSYRPGITRYVRIEGLRGIGQTGSDPRTRYSLNCTELVPDNEDYPVLYWTNSQVWDGSSVWG